MSVVDNELKVWLARTQKLRYAAEIFRSLLADKRSVRRYKRFVGAIEALQDELGALNDLATGPEVLEEHGLRRLPGADGLIVHAYKAKLIRTARTRWMRSSILSGSGAN